MTEMKVKNSPKMRKGEGGTLRIEVPKTDFIKQIRIMTPVGVVSGSGEKLFMSPQMTQIDIPLLVTEEAADSFELEIDLLEGFEEDQEPKNKLKHSMEVRE
jgi:hypothetical protein